MEQVVRLTTRRQIRVLIADNHALFCAGLVELLKEVPEVDSVAVATEVDEGDQLTRRLAFDVVVANPELDDAGPFRTARRLHPLDRKATLMFLDDRVRELNVRAAVQSHAEGYWTKHASFEEIRSAVLDLADGRVSFCPASRRYVRISRGRPKLRAQRRTTAVSRLTSRQLEVMRLLVQGFSVKQCAQQLEISPSTVDSHKGRMMKTLGAHSTVELTRLAISEKLVD